MLVNLLDIYFVTFADETNSTGRKLDMTLILWKTKLITIYKHNVHVIHEYYVHQCSIVYFVLNKTS